MSSASCLDVAVLLLAFHSLQLSIQSNLCGICRSFEFVSARRLQVSERQFDSRDSQRWEFRQIDVIIIITDKESHHMSTNNMTSKYEIAGDASVANKS